MVNWLRYVGLCILLPYLWCCSAPTHPPALDQNSPKELPSVGLPFAASVALVDDKGIFCAGVWVSETEVLTAEHCTEDESDVFLVQSQDGSQINMTVVRRDLRVDLALLSSPLAAGHAIAPLATSWYLGEPLSIVGHPDRTAWTWFRGYIAHEQMESSPDNGEDMLMLWVQAPIWYGNSGGGAFDPDGHLVGICSMRSAKIPEQSLFVSPAEIHAFLAAYHER